MTLAAELATLPDRCGHGYHATQHPALCACAGPDEWTAFVNALRTATRPDQTIHQGDVRPLIQGIPHKHRGLLYRKARTSGLIAVVGKEPSSDVAGRNTDKDSRVYRWIGGTR